ncbi:MAG: hypothetical protein Ct9H300mP6_07490 [Gammaproteobacteria bacterium]|nr:MAG: hypothetical protein Ct9H300mP6_07490 [Gammaproteobacteria bacterium]
MISSTFLSLVIVPIIYSWAEKENSGNDFIISKEALPVRIHDSGSHEIEL